MIITPQSLQALMVGFRADFQRGLASAESEHSKIATTIPGMGKSTTYGWLGKWPEFREWVGERVLKDMATHSYTVVNKPFESTVPIDRDEIEDDEIGVYGLMFEAMAEASVKFPSKLMFPLLKDGFSQHCYDGQNFFDPEHPVYKKVDGKGDHVPVSNMQDGSGDAWFLLDTSRVLKPLIYQERRKPEFTAMTKKDDESVFMSRLYRYGVDLRANGGYGFWQMGYGSKAELNAENLQKAYTAMRGFRADGGEPLDIKPTLLVTPTNLEDAATDILDTKELKGGGTNKLYKKFELLATGWL